MGTRFSIPPGARIRVLTVSADVTITGEERLDGEVEPGHAPGFRSGREIVEFKSRAGSMHIRAPSGTNVSVGTVSGNVTLRGVLGTVKVSTVSSPVRIQRAQEANIRTISGDITIESCGGQCRANSMGGTLRLPPQ